MKKINILLITLLVVPAFAFAAKNNKKEEKEKNEKPYPTGCVKVGYEYLHGTLILKSATEETPQSIFFIHNISSNNIEFHQARDGNRPYIMHNNNRLNANQWAVYATDQEQTKFICTVPNKDKTFGKVLDCGKLLKICQYPKVKFAINTRGNYWATTNTSKNSAVRTIIRQGILLKW